MNLPANLLRTLTAAVAAAGLAGCAANGSSDPQPGGPQPSDPTQPPVVCPVEQPGEFRHPDGCPACGQG